MSVTTCEDAPLRAERLVWSAAFPTLLVLLFVGVRLIAQVSQAGALTIEDDAYYYTIVARNLTQTGLSTFDGQALTNGYHPLWLAILALQAATVGGAVGVTIAIELALIAAAVWLFLTPFRSLSPLFRIGFAALFYLLAWPMVAKGMEVSLFLCAFALFLKCAFGLRAGQGGALMVGVAATLAIGARIDSAVFVIPIALLMARSRRDGVAVMLPIVIAGALYAAMNLFVFGIPFPISGAVKSLGGLQVNTALLHQIGAYFAPDAGLAHGLVRFLNSFIGRPLVFFVAPCLLLPFVRRTDKSWPLLLGYVAGFVLFATKLALFSSWVVWPWYAFTAVIGLVALFHALDDIFSRMPDRMGTGVQAVLAAALVVGVAVQIRGAVARPEQGFEPLNREAARRLAPVLLGARVAMGDRAGSFAGAYDGPVTQLEGLVNDVAWFRALERHVDVRPLLCARGVRFVLSYQRDLGAYDVATVPVLRPALTGFAAPALTFAKPDEVAQIFDPALFDNSRDDEGDNHLYVWRLRCAP